MEKDICLVLPSVVWSVHPTWRRSRPGKAFCTQSHNSFLREVFINLFGRRKVHTIEQAMAFGFLFYWERRESIRRAAVQGSVQCLRGVWCSTCICVYMLLGVVILKHTIRYIGLVNSLFRIALR